jgi:type IV secretory pathway VirB10-like protein
VSAGEEALTPRPRRLGPRALAAIGTVLCLVVGGIIVSVFRGGSAKVSAPAAKENPERPNEPRFLDSQPGGAAERVTAEIEARQREQERRRELLRDLLAAKTAPAEAGASPFSERGNEPAAYPAGRPSGETAEEPAAGLEETAGAPPSGADRPPAFRSGRSYPAAASADGAGPSSLARALAAPILLGAAKDQPEAAGARGTRTRFPAPPAPPDFKSVLAELRAGTGGEGTPPAGEGAAPAAVDFGRVVWAPAILLTALSSEAPGPAEAWIEADAKDPLGRVVLPQGSRVFGSYDTALTLGRKRLIVRWTSIELPDGTTLALAGAQSAGRDGAGGLRGRVDARLWGVFGRALALSAIGAAAQLGQPQESASFGASASNRQVAASAVATELSRAAADFIRQATDVKPIIRVPAGLQFFVFVPADLDVR